MAQRIVKDSAGRTWTCTSAATDSPDAARGKDVLVSCVSDSVPAPIELTVGWQWETMSEPGFARMITLQSPVPKR